MGELIAAAFARDLLKIVVVCAIVFTFLGFAGYAVVNAYPRPTRWILVYDINGNELGWVKCKPTQEFHQVEK